MGKCGSKTKKKAKYGLDYIDESKLIKLAYGDNANYAIQGTNTIGQAGFTAYNNAHPDKVNWGSNIGSGALSGVSLGANPALVAATGGLSLAAGAALGAGVGVVKSVIKKNELEKEEEAKAKADKERQDMINKAIYQGDLAQIQGDPTMVYGRDFSSYTMKYGGINIKPENRGKFTEYLKNTGSTLSEALNSKDPHVRQMANFANNAKHWKHAYGTDNLISYNNNLANKDTAFQNWYKKNTIEGNNNIPYNENFDYDYYSYYKNGGRNNYKKSHFPDTFKRPNHETFSNESIYSTPENPGGYWTGENYNKNGKFIYKNGGSINLGNGKEVIPIYGNSHEEGGVMIAPNVEAEGGEAIYGNKVASNRIGTDQKSIADRVKELGLLKQKYEVLAKQSNGNNKQKYLDIITKLDKEINTILKVQEQFKDAMGIPNSNKMWGGTDNLNGIINTSGNLSNSSYQPKIWNTVDYDILPILNDKPYLSRLDIYNGAKLNNDMQKAYSTYIQTPNINTDFTKAMNNSSYNTNNPKAMNNSSYNTNNPNNSNNLKFNQIITPDTVAFASTLIDNIGNNYLNNKLKRIEIPKPVLSKIRPLNTNYDIEGSLKAIDENTSRMNNIISSNIANSNVQLATKLALTNSNNQNKIGLYQTKTNTETQLKNNNLINVQQLEAINNNKIDEYNAAKYNKMVQTDFTNPSNNLANLQNDLKWAIERKDMNKYQAQQLMNEALKYQDSGVWTKTFESLIRTQPDIMNKISVDQLKEIYKNTNNKYAKENIEKYFKANNIKYS